MTAPATSATIAASRATARRGLRWSRMTCEGRVTELPPEESWVLQSIVGAASAGAQRSPCTPACGSPQHRSIVFDERRHAARSGRDQGYHADVAFPRTRLRRLRRTPVLRDLVRETRLQAGSLVLPLFVEEGLE